MLGAKVGLVAWLDLERVMRFKRVVVLAFSCLLLVSFAYRCVMADVDVANGLKHVDVVEIGETYQGMIVLKNDSDTTQEIRMYQTDYLYYYDEAGVRRVRYGEPGQDPRSNAHWISFDSHQLRIPPHEERSITYIVSVPSDETLVGTYWSLIMVQPVAVSAAPSSTLNESQVGANVTQLVRYAVRIETNIGDTGTREISIIGSQLSETDDGLLFRVYIENIGQRCLKPIICLEVYDEQGNLEGRFDSETRQRSIHPGCSARYLVSLPALESGSYPAMLYIDNLDEYVWGAQVNIEVR